MIPASRYGDRRGPVATGLQAALDRIVAAERGRGDVHEVALGVLEGGALTHACQGEWQGRPVGPDTPFLIASTSKLLITTMVFQLVGERRLALDDPVVRFFQLHDRARPYRMMIKAGLA